MTVSHSRSPKPFFPLLLFGQSTSFQCSRTVTTCLRDWGERRVNAAALRSACVMQYYTKQELQGAGRYTGKCRIGNWNENDTLDEVRTSRKAPRTNN